MEDERKRMQEERQKFEQMIQDERQRVEDRRKLDIERYAIEEEKKALFQLKTSGGTPSIPQPSLPKLPLKKSTLPSGYVNTPLPTQPPLSSDQQQTQLVFAWLEKHGFGDFKIEFESGGFITLALIALLDEEDLKMMDIPPQAHAGLLHAAAKLRSSKWYE